jgi:hypothetical protein
MAVSAGACRSTSTWRQHKWALARRSHHRDRGRDPELQVAVAQPGAVEASRSPSSMVCSVVSWPDAGSAGSNRPMVRNPSFRRDGRDAASASFSNSGPGLAFRLAPPPGLAASAEAAAAKRPASAPAVPPSSCFTVRRRSACRRPRPTPGAAGPRCPRAGSRAGAGQSGAARCDAFPVRERQGCPPRPGRRR